MPDLTQLTDEQLNVYKDLLAKKQGAPEAPKAPESTLGKVGNFLKGQVYDPTIGSIGQGMRDVATPGSRLKGTHEMISGAEKTLAPLGAVAAVTNPEVTLPALALGALGQTAGTYIPKMFGAGEDLSNVIGDVSGIVAGGLGARKAPNIISAGKGAYSGFADTPMGSHPFLRGWAGEQIGGSISPELRAPGYAAGLFSNKLAGAGRGLVEGLKNETVKPVETPPIGKVTPPKGPSVGELKSAVKNGNLTTEQFDQHIDSMNLTPEAKSIHKSDIRSELQKVNPPSMGQTQKLASFGTLKNAVKAGDKDVDWFKGRLKQQGYPDEDVELETNQLNREIEEAEKAEKERDEKPKSPKVEAPKKTETSKPEVELKL